jgi:transcriptional regulator with XRE-family HTH domain
MIHLIHLSLPIAPAPCLGDLLRERRTVLRLSLQQVADRAGTTKPHLWEMETGRSANPAVTTLVGLASALGLQPDALFRAAIVSTQREDAR